MDAQNPVYLEAEYYFMELEIKAIEADVNFAQGNIFIEAVIKNPFKDIQLNRMAAMDHKNLFEKLTKQALWFVPFARKFVDLEPFQVVRVPLLEYFDNSAFLAKEIQFELKNPSLMF